jgi:arylsulfatase A-like enzyme
MKRILLPLGVLSITACNDTAHDAERPNVLLIYADDIGYGDLSCYGTSAVKTPNVDKLASEGILFTNAHCAAATSTPSRYAMLTGEYAWRREGTGIAAGNAAMVINPERYTIADMFKDAGYNTGVVGKWHLGLGSETGKQDWNGHVSPNPCDLGFDYSYIMAATADRTPCIYMENGRGVGLDPSDPVYVSYTENFPGEPTGKDNPELLRIHPSQGHDQSIVNGIPRIGFMKGGKKALWKDEDIADSIAINAIRFIERSVREDEPFFLYLATNDIHVPRVPNERFAGKSGLGPRGDAILSFDWTVGEVMKTLERLGLDEKTIVILSSDNGAIIDDGYHDQAAELLGNHKPTGVFRGGKYSIYEGASRVPCILRWKGKVLPGSSESLMSRLDWIASFAGMFGVEIPSGAAPDSADNLDSWFDSNASGRSYMVTQNLQNNLSITDGVWKYIPAAEGPAIEFYTGMELGNNISEHQLYNLKEDPSESVNVHEFNPEKSKELRSELIQIIQSGVHYKSLEEVGF